MNTEDLNWPHTPPKWDKEAANLLLEMKIDKDNVSKHFTVEEIMENSEKFPVNFPVETGRIKYINEQKGVTNGYLTKNINSVYPLVHECTLELFAKFLIFKLKNGSTVEKELYTNMNLKQLIDRLITKRAVYFFGKYDKYKIISGHEGSNGWEKIGTDQEKPPLTLSNCLSYDEIKLSALLYVSSYTYFVNKGDRRNNAVFCADRASIQDDGIIVGMIGPRMKKPYVMDYQEIVVSPSQNKKGYEYEENNKSSIHSLMADFYGEKNVEWNENLKSQTSRYVTLNPTTLFDNRIYQKRLNITFDALLLEANSRAKEARKSCYLHVVGLGLGVWMISKHQEKVYMDSFYQRIIFFQNHLDSVSDICFSWFKEKSCGGYKDGQKIPLKNHPLGGIRVHIMQREPHERLLGEHKDKLLVVSYAWDGNALPGNEYWMGKLDSSGDPAAASSTQIAELHNPHIHPGICAENLRVLSGTDGGILNIQQYQEKIRRRNETTEKS